MSQFEIDGLNELEIISIGEESFYLDGNSRLGMKCLIMNCDQLSDIHFGCFSFRWYESFESKNLRSLISIQLDYGAFCICHWIEFDSMIDVDLIDEIFLLSV